MKFYWSFALSTFFLCNTALAQAGKDTIYLDENWSICEKPVAAYYRVAALQVNKELVYTGEVADHYMDGEILMKGLYDDEGRRNGHFVFYRQNGKKSKEGDFEKDEMRGIWSYYDENESLRAQFDCKSETDFTPLFLVTTSGDTLLKNGNGRFLFNSQKDFPQVFVENYTVEGQVVNGKKEGEIKFWINTKKGKTPPFCTEVFKNGTFKKIKLGTSQTDTKRTCRLLNLLSETHLYKTDVFYHSNLAFPFGNAGDEKLVRFLLHGEAPEITATAQTYQENIKDIYNILEAVLRPSLMPTVATETRYQNPPTASAEHEILFFAAPAKDIASHRIINSELTLTIDTGGFISKTVFKGNLNKAEINKINYHLSLLTNLVPFGENGQLKNAELNLALLTLADTPRKKKSESFVSYTYLAVNSDSLPSRQLAANDNDKPAAFAGGAYAWKMYLLKNLNAAAPLKDRAPAGTYAVKVQFTVDEQGNVTDVRAVEAPKKCPRCTAEAVRVIKEGPDWEPALKDGVNVTSVVTLVITFVHMK